MEETPKEPLSDGVKITLRMLAIFFDTIPLIFLLGGAMAFSAVGVSAALSALVSWVPLVGWAVGAVLNTFGLGVGLVGSTMFVFLSKCFSMFGGPAISIAFYTAGMSNLDKNIYIRILMATLSEGLLEILPIWTIVVETSIRAEDAKRAEAARKYTDTEGGGRREKRRFDRESVESTDIYAYTS